MIENTIPEKWRWFPDARYGLFIHWGPYSQIGRGEQVLFREHWDQADYEAVARDWNPSGFDAREWAELAVKSGMRYACFTTKHHDGYCLWDSALTNYSSARQAPQRDFVAEYVEAFRSAGLKVGLYYSWCDWGDPAFFDGPELDPSGWESTRRYMHAQVEELLTNYGPIDYFFFDGAWPRTAEELGSEALVRRMRELQPGILINNRLGEPSEGGAAGAPAHADGGQGPGESTAGDFDTPERTVVATPGRLWESCEVSTWRLWGFAAGERWKPAELLLDILCECAEKGGNLLLNVGPDGEGRMPFEFQERALSIGDWLLQNGEAIYGIGSGDVTDVATVGRQTVRGNNLYLIVRFWPHESVLRLADLGSPVVSVALLGLEEELDFETRDGALFIRLPESAPRGPLFPVLRIQCEGIPTATAWGAQRLWSGDPTRIAEWARESSRAIQK